MDTDPREFILDMTRHLDGNTQNNIVVFDFN